MTDTPKAPLITAEECRAIASRLVRGGTDELAQAMDALHAAADHLDRAARFARWLEDEIEARTRSLPTALSDTERDQMIVGIQAREKVLAEYRRLGLSGSAAARTARQEER